MARSILPRPGPIAFLLGSFLATGAVSAGDEVPLRSLDPPVLLPDGSEFRTWEAPAEFTRTHHVDQRHPAASDENPGTSDRPFKTIQRAAEVLEPGERVVVSRGVYRERVRPARGGSGPGKMISYEAAPGEEVVIKGSRLFDAAWSPSAPAGKSPLPGVWQAKLDPSRFEGYNPFDIENVTPKQFATMSWATPLKGKPPCVLPRGLVFQDGKLLAQVAAYEDLAAREGTYWIDRPAQVLHVRPSGGVDPGKAGWEITTQETVFAPAEAGLGFIRVKGLVVQESGGPFPWEQVGAISTTRGHHWIIEDNTVRFANGVGIDAGSQHPELPQPETIGHHIVRRNTVTDCGIAGICGLGPGRGRDFGLLIEDNVLARNAFHDVERLYETGGIKTHNNIRCLIRRNLITDTIHGAGIWMDWDNQYSRSTQNVIAGAHTLHGGIFVEASYLPNLIDQNFIWGIEGHGIYEHDSCRQVFAHNFIGRCTGSGLHLHGKITDRNISGRPIVGGSHRVRNNVLFENGKGDVFLGEPSDIAGNLERGISASFDPASRELTWSVSGKPPACEEIEGLTHDFWGKPRAEGAPVPGPFGEAPERPARVRLGPSRPIGSPILVNPDGAWCWFQDRRALFHDGKLTVASITSGGDVQASTWDLARGSVAVRTLRAGFTADDHNDAALLLRADGRLMAFYARHHQEPLMYWRVTARPGDTSLWEREDSFDGMVQDRFTYANPFQLPAEGGRIHLFWRGLDFNPTWSSTDDGGKTWTKGANAIYFKKGERPYVKYASNGKDTIHFAFTEGHPNRPYRTSLYHAFYRAGSLHASDGKAVRALAEGPIVPSEATMVYDGKGETGEAWVWDVALDPEGNPAIAYTSHPGPGDIRYRYARWDGKGWEDRQIGFAGSRLYRGEEYYAGGIAIDPDDVSIVYASSNVRIAGGGPAKGGRYEIHKGLTRDGGRSWEWRPLTRDSRTDNLRPLVPAGHPPGTFVLWFRGTYTSYTRFRTEAVALADAPVPAVTERVLPEPAFRLRGEVVDAATGKAIPARVYIRDEKGEWLFPRSASPEGSAVRYDKQNWIEKDSVERHTSLSAHPFEIDLPPGRYAVEAERGKEYRTLRQTVEVKDGPVSLKLPLERWIDLAARGWYSGDTHVHRSIVELPCAMLAEDLNVAFPLVWWVTRAGTPPTAGDKSTQVPVQDLIEVDRTHAISTRNTEYEIFTAGGKPHTLGAFFALNHGPVLEAGAPPVRPIAEEAHRRGALIDLEKHDWPWSIALVPVMGVDLFELANNHLWRTGFAFKGWTTPGAEYMGLPGGGKGGGELEWILYGLETYYALLDSGFHLKPAAGTASGVHPVPLGFSRVYVHLDGEFSFEAWFKGLAEGRSFATTGPMLFVEVEGKLPGHVFPAEGPAEHRLAVTAVGEAPLAKVEVVRNGKVVRSIAPSNREAAGGGFESRFEETIRIEGSGWLAVRAFEERPGGRVRFAHTGPFWFEVPGKPLRPSREEIGFLIRRVHDEIQRSAGVLAPEAIEEYEKAWGVYEGILKGL